METLKNMSMPATLADLANAFADARAQREKIEALAKEAKAKEEQLKESLISEMAAQQIPSVKFDKVGRFVLKPSVRYDIADINLVARAMLAQMVDNGKNGRPLSDGLILQKRTAKTVIEEMADALSWGEKDFAERGLTPVEKMDMTFTRIKN